MGQKQSKRENEEEQNEHERLGLVKLELREQSPTQMEEDEESYIMHLKKSVESQRIYDDWVKSMNSINDS